MKFQVGDVVRYLNDVGGGVVQKIVSPMVVEIVDESGFTVPVRENELILIERPEKQEQSYLNSVPSAPQNPIEIDESIEDDDIEGNEIPQLFMAFVRNAKDSSLFELYLINDCNYHILYVLSSEDGNEVSRINSGLLEANTKYMIAQISYEEISKMERLHCQAVYFKNKKYAMQNAVDVQVAINPVKFYKPGVFIVNDFFDEDAYVISVYDAADIQYKKEQDLLRNIEPRQIAESMQTKNVVEKQPVMVKKEEKIREIDLHIHELVDNPEQMKPSEMLDIQLQTFERELVKAVSDGIEKIVFIHGVGNGILKAKIRGCLDRDYPQYFYQDASFEKYKFGATLVYLRKVYR